MNNNPLADRLRPKKLSYIIGQKHLIGQDKIITNLVKNKKLFSSYSEVEELVVCDI